MFDFGTLASQINVENNEHLMFSGDLAKLAITLTDVDKIFGNLAICLQLDVALLVQNIFTISDTV